MYNDGFNQKREETALDYVIQNNLQRKLILPWEKKCLKHQHDSILNAKESTCFGYKFFGDCVRKNKKYFCRTCFESLNTKGGELVKVKLLEESLDYYRTSVCKFYEYQKREETLRKKKGDGKPNKSKKKKGKLFKTNWIPLGQTGLI